MWLFTSSAGTSTLLQRPPAGVPPRQRPSPGTDTTLTSLTQAAQMLWVGNLQEWNSGESDAFIFSKPKLHWHGKQLRADVTGKRWSFSGSGSGTGNASPRSSSVTWVKDSLRCRLPAAESRGRKPEVLKLRGIWSNTLVSSSFFLCPSLESIPSP